LVEEFINRPKLNNLF